jgi:hypothetical protein
VGRESGHKGINREGRGRVCGGQQVAGENLYRIGRGEIQGYGSLGDFEDQKQIMGISTTRAFLTTIKYTNSYLKS